MRPGFSCIDQGLASRPWARRYTPPERAIYEGRATGVKLFALNWPSETDLIADTLAYPGFSATDRFRANAVLLRRINVIWAVQSPFAKIFPFPFGPNHLHISRRLVPLEGRLAIVTDAGRDAVDGRRRQRRRRLARGRRSRVVLTPRRWRQVSRKYPQGDGAVKSGATH
jgi:hypothetical protein